MRTRLRQGASRYSQKGLVSSRLARERQLLHPLSVRSWEHPGNAGIFKPLRSRPERRADHARRMMTAQAIPQFWLQRTNVWRRVTNLAQGAKRLTSVIRNPNDPCVFPHSSIRSKGVPAGLDRKSPAI